MEERDFRDYVRNRLSDFDGRIERFRAEFKELAGKARPPEERIKGHMGELIELVARMHREGRLLALQLAFIDVEHKAEVGYALSEGYFQLAGAAQLAGLQILQDFSRYAELPEGANDEAK